MGHEFLTEDWFTEVDKIREEMGNPEPSPQVKDMKLNIVVTGCPSGDDCEINMNAGDFGRGLLDDAPTKMTVPFEVAKQVFIEGNQQAGMQAFMQGQVKVEGDMTKLMAMQTVQPSPEQQNMQQRIKEITA